MNKLDALLDILSKIYFLLKQSFDENRSKKQISNDEPMTRQQVKDYLGISESTYKRKVKDGTLKPFKFPGGDRYYKHQLLTEFHESKRRGRI